GTITFTLFDPNGDLVDTETVEVSGNGTYKPTRYQPPPMAARTDHRSPEDRRYASDGNNATASDSFSDSNDPAEQASRGPASPMISTTPSPITVHNAAGGVTLTDTADLEGGFAPTGTITFTLFDPNGDQVDTETARVNGNGTYKPTGYLLPSMATGTYQW